MCEIDIWMFLEQFGTHCMWNRYLKVSENALLVFSYEIRAQLREFTLSIFLSILLFLDKNIKVNINIKVAKKKTTARSCKDIKSINHILVIWAK